MLSSGCYCLDYIRLHWVEISARCFSNLSPISALGECFADSVSCDKSSSMGSVSYPHVQLIRNLWPITLSIGQRHMTYETIFQHHF